MKRIGLLMTASIALLVASCSTTEETVETPEVESITYTLDAENSKLTWAASMSPEYGHEGTVDITEGTLVMEGEEISSGSFTIDMTTIKSTDLEEPKAGKLASHLMGTAPDEDHPVDLFFNVPAFPTVGVTLGEFKDGNLSITLSILGKELQQDIAVALSSDGNEASIIGAFSIDFDSLGIPGLQPNPEDGSQIGPVIDFDLTVKLKK